MPESDNSVFYYDILLPVATEGVYTYTSSRELQPGQRVTVPLAKRKVTGLCLQKTVPPKFKCRDIEAVLDDYPVFPASWLEFIKKIADYYVATLGITLHGVVSQKILASVSPEKPLAIPIKTPVPIALSPDQHSICESIPLDGYSAHLIQGVTGSGKTEVYLDLIQRVIESGRQVIYLVPEIALTPQLVDRFTERLGFPPALYHSKLTEKKRNEAFWGFVEGRAPLLLGARSALFVPSSKLGLVIVDEEHETTFKQEETPPYHLRDMAVLYASLLNIPVIMGSATPQVESVANARSGKYAIHYLSARHGAAQLPKINLIDIKQHNLAGGIMAEPLYDMLYQTVTEGRQAIMFLNRKGYATSLFCMQCGQIHECINCSVPLTMYKSVGHCTCHYCGSDYRYLECPNCGCREVIDMGAGTERVEEFLEQMFPNNIVRIDADKISTFSQLNKALDRFYSKSAQILVGTQLIAKGLHFPDVTFVGIMGIDNILSMPDFRSVEKAYQLLMQVSGRAGRGDKKGEVHIQTFMPEHPLFKYLHEDPSHFYDYELERRRAFGYPPYSKMARLLFAYSQNREVQIAAQAVVEGILKEGYPADVLGPAPAVIQKIKNQFRYSVLLKTSSNNAMKGMLTTAKKTFEQYKTGTMSMKVDRDPYFFM